MNNQTITLLSSDLFFSLGRLAAVLSLLFIVILILIVIFLLFFIPRNMSNIDEHELRTETDASTTENKILELSSFKQYASTDNNQLMPMNSFQMEINEQMTRSTMNLISSQ